MNAHGTAGRLLVGLTVVALVGGCASGASGSPAPASPSLAASPSTAIATPTPAAAATAAPTRNVAYESADAVLVPGVLDVYAPAEAGPLPVVVMFPPPGDSAMALMSYARGVADLGFVVFVSSGGRNPIGGAAPTYADVLAGNSQAACAVAFARAHAAEYGGDPATMIVFGHSGGAQTAAMVAFARPELSAGCLGGPTLGAIDALVTWEGDWMMSVTHPRLADKDGWLAADSRIMDAFTPWTYLAEHKDLKVAMLVSEDPSLSLESEFPGVLVDRELGDPWAADSWLAVRDPSGALRRQLEANGALADGMLTFTEVQQLLYSVLKAQGNPVSLDVMPDSTHDALSRAGRKVLLAAFPKAAAQD
jgi:acetyl esterase/lipase